MGGSLPLLHGNAYRAQAGAALDTIGVETWKDLKAIARVRSAMDIQEFFLNHRFR